MLQKGRVNVNLFKLLTRQKKESKVSSSDINNHSIGINDKNIKNIDLTTNDIKLPTPSLKDMEFSWSDNY